MEDAPNDDVATPLAGPSRSMRVLDDSALNEDVAPQQVSTTRSVRILDDGALKDDGASPDCSPSEGLNGSFRTRSRIKSSMSDYLQASGYYVCISKEPLPLRWDREEESPAGICFEYGNIVRMRSFFYKEPHLWAEVLNGGFVCAGVGDTRKEAAGDLLEEYFEPYQLPSGLDDEELVVAKRKLERQATNALRQMTMSFSSSRGSIKSRGSIMSLSSQLEGAEEDASSEFSSEDEDDGHADRIIELFKRFDINGDGTIECEEMATVLKAIDPKKWTNDKVRHLMNIMDINKDRQISYEEFVDWVCSSCRWRRERRMFFKELGVDTGELQEMAQEVQRRGSVIKSSIAEWNKD